MERRKQRLKSLQFIFFLVFFIWILLLFLAPFALPADSISDLSGFVGVADNENVNRLLSFPWNAIYSSGDRLCHQKADRSLFLNGNEMPFCARCIAIWLGLAVGLGFMVFYRIELTEKFLIPLFVALSPLGIDGTGQLLGFWESTNLIRVLTGLPAGIICGIAVGIILDEISTMWVSRRLGNFSKT